MPKLILQYSIERILLACHGKSLISSFSANNPPPTYFTSQRNCHFIGSYTIILPMHLPVVNHLGTNARSFKIEFSQAHGDSTCQVARADTKL